MPLDALPSPVTKTCCQCATCRPAADFLPCSQSDDGLTKRCRPCVLANAAQDRAEREARQAARAAEAPRKPASAAERCLIERISA